MRGRTDRDGALVGNGLGQSEAAEAAHRLGFVEEVLHGGVVWVDDSRTLIPIDQPDELAAHLDVFLANHTF